MGRREGRSGGHQSTSRVALRSEALSSLARETPTLAAAPNEVWTRHEKEEQLSP